MSVPSVTTRPDPPEVRRRHAAIERLLSGRDVQWKRAPGNRWILNRSIDLQVTNEKTLPLRVRVGGAVVAGFWMPIDALTYGEWLAGSTE